MVRTGRDLELLVKALERMDLQGAIVKSPDFLYDKVAEENREVDVSIKTRIGTHEIIIIFECRDRKTKPGPDWIEQLAQKTKDLGAHKVVAVSSSGFTKSAAKKALKNNIELRTLEGITSKEIFSWFSPQSIPVVIDRFLVKKIDFIENRTDFGNSKELVAFIEKCNKNADKNTKFISQDNGETFFSINEIHSNIKDNEKLFSFITDEKKRYTIPFELLTKEKTGYLLVLGDDRIKVDGILVTAEIWREKIQCNLSSKKGYKNDSQTISQVLTFDDVTSDKSLQIVLKESTDGNQMGFRFKNMFP